MNPVIIGMLGGDGIGPTITYESQRVLEQLLADAVKSGKVQFRNIDGLTIENRAEKLQSIPDDVLAEIKRCHVTLKGPTHTPEKGDGWPNIESANVSMRKALDLFANVRPVRIPAENIDWTFFRENTEDMYALGSNGINGYPRPGHRLPRHHDAGLAAHHRRSVRSRAQDRQGARSPS